MILIQYINTIFGFKDFEEGLVDIICKKVKDKNNVVEYNNEYVQIDKNNKIVEPHAFCKCNIKYVIISNSIKELGGYAFESCLNLRRICLSNNLRIINKGLLFNCSSL